MSISHKLLIIIFIISPISALFGDEIYPEEFSIRDIIPDGVIYSLPNSKYMLVKSFSERNLTSVYLMNDPNKGPGSGFQLSGVVINCGLVVNKGLAIIFSEGDRLFAGILDTSFNITNRADFNFRNEYFNDEIIGADLSVSSSDSISSDLNLLNDMSLRTLNSRAIKSCKWVGSVGDGKYLFLVDKVLYQFELVGNEGLVRIINDNVIDVAINSADNNKERNYVILSGRDASSVLIRMNYQGEAKIIARLPLFDKNKIYLSELDDVFIISSNETGKSLITHIKAEIILGSYWLPALYNGFFIDSKTKSLYYLTFISGHYELVKIGFNQRNSSESKSITEFPSELIEPFGIYDVNENFIVLFRNGICSFNVNDELIGADFAIFGELIGSRVNIQEINDKIIITSDNTTAIIDKSYNYLWFVSRFLNSSGQYLVPILLLFVSIILLQLYRHQRRLLHELVELPTSGLIFVVDKKGRLTRANRIAKDIMDFKESMSLHKSFGYYFHSESLFQLRLLIEDSLVKRENLSKRLIIAHGSEVKEWYVTVMPLRNITGIFRGLLITGFDITEQLQRRRLQNWAQLAHDMQTNLSTIRLNAEQLDIDNHEKNVERRRKIIYQANILINRVRDLVTVGRSDKADYDMALSSQICHDVRNEFDEAMFPHVKFDLNINEFTMKCDKAKLIRALRNAVENSIKSFKGNNGLITIGCQKDVKYAYYFVSDNGPGMDYETRANILKPFFTTSKDAGSTGIGTMIMQQVAELHGGKIEIVSEPGKGTKVIFLIPLFS